MTRKGVCYDVGRVLYGNWRKDYNFDTVRRELDIIRRDLHCNAVRICGREIARLEEASEYALEIGLEVWYSPEMWNRSPEATLAYTLGAAEVAERLRTRYPDRLIMSVGSELTLFMKGIIGGRTFWSRMRNAFSGGAVRAGRHNAPLDAYLSRATAAVRRVFHGPITYASLPFEEVDWDRFDYVGVDHYRATRFKEQYGESLRPLLASGKPVAVMEFGCCTYQGAEDAGGRAFDIVDTGSLAMHQIPFFGRFVRPRLKGSYVRDETLQAREIVDQLTVIDREGVDAAFVFTFVFPNNPTDEDPRYDLDMASYSLVKSFAGGRHGSTYREMTWEPKEAFGALADYYAK